MKCKVILFLFFWSTLSAASQSTKIDSLKRNIGKAQPGNEQLQAILFLCDQGYSLHPDTLMAYAGTARAMAQQQQNLHDEVKALYYISFALTNKGLIDSSQDAANQCLSMLSGAVKDRVLEGNILNQKGRCFMRKNQYKEAIDMGYQVIEGAEKSRDTLLQIKGKTLIGWAYLEMGQTQEALNWHLKALKTTQDIRLLEKYGILFANLALNYNGLGKTDSAFYFITRAINFSRKHENLFALSNSLAIQAQLYVRSGRSALAEAPLKEVVAIRKLIGDPFYIVSDMSQLGLYYAHNGQPEKGIAICNEGIAIANEFKIDTKLFFLYSTLGENYKVIGNMQKYAETLEKIIILKDTVYQKNSAVALAEMQTKYDLQKKENTIIRQNLSLIKKNYLLYGSLLLLVIVLAAAYAIFRSYRRRQQLKMQFMLEAEKSLSVQAVNEAQEKERRRIAADLHDNLGVQANAILYNTELLKQEHTGKEDLVDDLYDTAKEMLLNLRETLWAMKTADVSAPDLWLRIISFSKQMGRHYSAIKFTTEGAAPPALILPSAQALNSVMIVQEAVNNAAKHSGAKQVTVKSNMVNTDWQIRITDDGKGFDLTTASSKKDSHGLNHMQERAKATGLIVKIETKKEGGTTIVVTITP